MLLSLLPSVGWEMRTVAVFCGWEDNWRRTGHVSQIRDKFTGSVSGLSRALRATRLRSCIGVWQPSRLPF